MIGEFVQKKIGKIVNIEPGSEMLAALKLAEKSKADIALIDRDISITMKRFSKNFRKRELFRLLIDSFRPPAEEMAFDFSKIPPEELVRKVIRYTKKRYPSLHRILIDERDIYMARQLHRLHRLFPDKKILAVMGAGHIDGVLAYLNKEQ